MSFVIRQLRLRCMYLSQLLNYSFSFYECKHIRGKPNGPHPSVIEYAASTLIAQLTYKIHLQNISLVT